ncbi:MAG: 30S ribosomal protein S18 [Planctomycetes bacterium]|nr:30S ribosomal protein S18 [Planctomycetota bacterium]
MMRGGNFGKESSRCRFCRDKVYHIDHKDLQSLQKLCTAQGKIFSRKRSGNCAFHQRSAKAAFKRARYMALMPYVG